MSATKILIVVLVLVAALFAVLIVMGSRTNNSVHTTGDPKIDAQNFQIGAYPSISGLGATLGSFGPRLDPKQLQPSATSFNLQTKASYLLTVAADSGHSFRNAKLTMTPASGPECAHIVYDSSSAPPTGLSDLQHQDPAASRKLNDTADKYKASLVILGGGGAIKIDRTSASPTPCTVRFE